MLDEYRRHQHAGKVSGASIAATRFSTASCTFSTAHTSNLTHALVRDAEFLSQLREASVETFPKAKAQGKYKGRAPTARAKAPEIRGLHAQGVGPSEIARRLGISRVVSIVPSREYQLAFDVA